MKSAFAIFLLILLLFSAQSLAESYDQYKVPTHLEDAIVFTFENGDTISFQAAEKCLLWEREGQAVAVVSQENYEYLNDTVRVIQLKNGQYGVLMRENAFGESCRIEYWIWAEQSMDKIGTWESKSFAYCDKGFLLFDSENHILLYDCYANELWRGDFNEEKEYRPYLLRMRSIEDWICSLYIRNESGQHYACIRVVNGQIAWHRQFDSLESSIFRFLPLKDGWTVIALSRNDGKYSPIKILILDQKGNVHTEYEISSERKLLVEASLLLEADDGAVLIYGSAVSNRQKVYLVWKLQFYAQSGVCSWDVRNCEYHGDYSPGPTVGTTQQVHEAPVFVRLRPADGSNAPAVRIPFEKLPVVTERYLRKR